MFDLSPRSIVPFDREEILSKNYLEQFLRFYLAPNTTMLLPVSQIREAIEIPTGKIIPIAHMPAWVMGVYNGRGEILWTIDLGLMLGLIPWHKQIHKTSSYKTIVIRGSIGNPETQETNQIGLALVVSRIEDMEWHDPQELKIDTAQFTTPTSEPFTVGYWLQPNGDVRLCLDGAAILAAMQQR
jgi:positive phototaxis protein PixI